MLLLYRTSKFYQRTKLYFMRKNFYFLFATLISISMLTQKSSAQSGYWSLKGNSGLNDTSNFLGTTDAHPLIFKVDKKRSGYIDFDPSKANTAFGYQALFFNSGYNNSAFGYKALYKNTSGVNNIAIGTNALYSNTFGQDNIAIGPLALYNNTFGNFNTAIGQGTLSTNIAGNSNTAIGQAAMAQNKRGDDNTATGYIALYFNTSSKNTATGSNALYDNLTGNSNTATGYLTLYRNDNGSNNTATGSGSLFHNLYGNYNTADGVGALTTNESGSRNTALGAYADVTGLTFNNSTAVGFGASVDASDKVQIGNIYVKSIGGSVGWTNYSDERIKDNIKENVPGLAFITKLKPVTYHFNVAKENELSGKKDSLNQAVESNIEKIQYTGLIAQDVDAAAKKINYDFSGVDKTGKIMGLRYSEFVVPLVKAVQELSNKNDSLQRQLTDMQSRIEKLEAASGTTAQNMQVAGIGTAATMEQNVPNPFNASTNIGYYLPANAINSYVNIYASGGNMVKSIKINGTGKGVINLQSKGMLPGSYQYVLVIAGKVVAKKQFIRE
jgi:trimeric autotransporter adhesin